jgi:hypothetical protein
VALELLIQKYYSHSGTKVGGECHFAKWTLCVDDEKGAKKSNAKTVQIGKKKKLLVDR